MQHRLLLILEIVCVAGGTTLSASDVLAAQKQETSQVVQPQADSPSRAHLPFEYLAPWVPEDFTRMAKLNEVNKWPKYLPESDLGILVTGVCEQATGIQLNDVIYAINGQSITSEEKLAKALRSLRGGEKFLVKLKRVQPNSKGEPRWLVVEGGQGVMLTDAEKQANRDRLEAALAARKAAEQEKERQKLEAIEREKTRLYTLSDGRQLTGDQIEEHNKRVLRKVAADFVGKDFDERLRYTDAQRAINPLVRLLEKGDRQGLSNYMLSLASLSDIAKEVRTIMIHEDSREAILRRDDGTALFWHEAWEEATASLLPATP